MTVCERVLSHDIGGCDHMGLGEKTVSLLETNNNNIINENLYSMIGSYHKGKAKGTRTSKIFCVLYPHFMKLIC